MKTTALVITSLLAVQPLVAMAESDTGAMTLNTDQMDGITAGSLPLIAIQANAGSIGSFNINSTNTLAHVLAHPISGAQYGNPLGYATAAGGTATSTVSGEGATQSTSISVSEDPAPSPFGATIDKGLSVLGTTIQGYSTVQPGGIVHDWLVYQMDKIQPTIP